MERIPAFSVSVFSPSLAFSAGLPVSQAPMAQAVAVAQPVGQQTAQPVGQASFYSAGQSALQQWFAMVDTDRSGQISATELQQALSQGGLTYSLKMVASIIRSQAPPGSIQLGAQPCPARCAQPMPSSPRAVCRLPRFLSHATDAKRNPAGVCTHVPKLSPVLGPWIPTWSPPKSHQAHALLVPACIALGSLLSAS